MLKQQFSFYNEEYENLKSFIGLYTVHVQQASYWGLLINNTLDHTYLQTKQLKQDNYLPTSHEQQYNIGTMFSILSLVNFNSIIVNINHPIATSIVYFFDQLNIDPEIDSITSLTKQQVKIIINKQEQQQINNILQKTQVYEL